MTFVIVPTTTRGGKYINVPTITYTGDGLISFGATLLGRVPTSHVNVQAYIDEEAKRMAFSFHAEANANTRKLRYQAGLGSLRNCIGWASVARVLRSFGYTPYASLEVKYDKELRLWVVQQNAVTSKDIKNKEI